MIAKQEQESPMLNVEVNPKLMNVTHLLRIKEITDKIGTHTSFYEYDSAKALAEELIVEARLLRNTFIMIDESENRTK